MVVNKAGPSAEFQLASAGSECCESSYDKIVRIREGEDKSRGNGINPEEFSHINNSEKG